MSKPQGMPDTQRILSGLKDFQRKTVDYVFRRLYVDSDRVKRFLVADEAGLGKTLVARGVVAKAIEHIWDTVDRIDIIYICANRDIAKQNINRLNITGREDVALATRMTLLPMYVHNLHGNKINFVSFTPGTSFNLRSTGGTARERALIYHILREDWRLGDVAGPKNLLQRHVGKAHWRRMLHEFDTDAIDAPLSKAYLKALRKHPDIRRRFRKLSKTFAWSREHVPREDRQVQGDLIGCLRRVLAESCVDALEPDIVILDEFQRFKTLLDADDEVARLARAVFDFPAAKVLLLSATPYKMYTMHHEQEDDDHYADFIRTVRFLLNSEEQTEEFREDLRRYRQALLQLGNGGEDRLLQAKETIERKLRKVMVRTERLSATADRSGMISESHAMPVAVAPQDLRDFSVLDDVARRLGVGDTVEYWKSAPYLLNVMDRDGYKIKREFVSRVEEGAHPGLADVLSSARDSLLQWEAIKSYQKIEPANAKLRSLLAQKVEGGAWELLWVPPSLPYYRVADGPYTDPGLRDFTKALIFSSWLVVPKVIAMLCSYEAERRMVLASERRPDYETIVRRRRNLLRFARSQGRYTGMSNFTLLYPCLTLAATIDPLVISARLTEGGDLPAAEAVTGEVSARLAEMLEPILAKYASDDGPIDESWYWATPVLLDRHHCRHAMKRWLDIDEGPLAWDGMVRTQEDADSRFSEHVEELCERLHARQKLGRPPADLLEVLTKIALASPAVVALRSLLRSCRPENPLRASRSLLASAARVAMGFRTLFNLPQSITVVRSLRSADDSRYWESSLDYCLNGNLQSVMDEYVHVLRESLGLIDIAPDRAAEDLAEEIHTALSVQTVSLFFDQIDATPGGTVELSRHSIRCRFALRFGDGRDQEEKTEVRRELVRKAFNSPFQPFVLASTSIGQEGLDFHQYCHEIFHWNLPANPVDLEQREGRIHRYKGHVIRRNVATAFPLASLAGTIEPLIDPWAKAFSMAHRARPEDQDDLVPYWIFECPGGHKVYRHIPSLPLSREHQHIEDLRRTLVAYRMVLGQPRQEDLVTYLQQRFEGGVDPEMLLKYRIDLAPGAGPGRAPDTSAI